MKTIAKLGLIALLCGQTSTALADDLCTDACPEGKKRAAFADGNNQTCLCVAVGEGMVETVPEEVESPGDTDIGWTADSSGGGEGEEGGDGEEGEES